MSAANIFVSPAEAVVFTDGAWVDPQGIVREIRPKIISLAHMPAVIATQGGSILAGIVAVDFERRFFTFDDMLAGASAFMRDPPQHYAPLLANPVFTAERLFLIGYSAAAGEVQAFYLQAMPEDDLPPWTPRKFTTTISPQVEVVWDRIDNKGAFPTKGRALRIMEKQRAIMFDLAHGNTALAVGGFCLETVCTAEGIRSSVIRRWPDKIGERLNRDVVLF